MQTIKWDTGLLTHVHSLRGIKSMYKDQFVQQLLLTLNELVLCLQVTQYESRWMGKKESKCQW